MPGRCAGTLRRAASPSAIPRRWNASRPNSGYRDWNTAVARLSNEPEFRIQVGDAVSGTYLKQPFTGRVLAVRELAGGSHFQVTLHLDEAVDVVTFDSFSSFRQRVNATINDEGVSRSRTSDGEPHLVIRPLTSAVA